MLGGEGFGCSAALEHLRRRHRSPRNAACHRVSQRLVRTQEHDRKIPLVYPIVSYYYVYIYIYITYIHIYMYTLVSPIVHDFSQTQNLLLFQLGEGDRPTSWSPSTVLSHLGGRRENGGGGSINAGCPLMDGFYTEKTGENGWFGRETTRWWWVKTLVAKLWNWWMDVNGWLFPYDLGRPSSHIGCQASFRHADPRSPQAQTSALASVSRSSRRTLFRNGIHPIRIITRSNNSHYCNNHDIVLLLLLLYVITTNDNNKYIIMVISW